MNAFIGLRMAAFPVLALLRVLFLVLREVRNKLLGLFEVKSVELIGMVRPHEPPERALCDCSSRAESWRCRFCGASGAALFDGTSALP